jgi:hypothetical protein
MRAELRRTLPRRNDFGLINYPALMGEAQHFGLKTRAQFRRLLLRHRRALIEADREPLDAVHQRIFRSEMGAAQFLDLIRRQRWFSWEALTRLAARAGARSNSTSPSLGNSKHSHCGGSRSIIRLRESFR